MPFAVGGVYSDVGLQEDEMTIPKLLKKQNYATACIGKWHLGIPQGFNYQTQEGFTSDSEFHPNRHGFDLFFGVAGNSSPDGSLVLFENDGIVEKDAHVSTITEHYTRRLIDFIRVHISQVGGLTMARKMAAMSEFFNVRTAWHGPGDVSPVGHAANVHLDLAVPNFGIQEAREFNQAEEDVFPGCPKLKDGYYHVNDRPGLGIDLDEKLAAKFPIKDDPPFDMPWGNYRRADGTSVKP